MRGTGLQSRGAGVKTSVSRTYPSTSTDGVKADAFLVEGRVRQQLPELVASIITYNFNLNAPGWRLCMRIRSLHTLISAFEVFIRNRIQVCGKIY